MFKQEASEKSSQSKRSAYSELQEIICTLQERKQTKMSPYEWEINQNSQSWINSECQLTVFTCFCVVFTCFYVVFICFHLFLCCFHLFLCCFHLFSPVFVLFSSVFTCFCVVFIVFPAAETLTRRRGSNCFKCGHLPSNNKLWLNLRSNDTLRRKPATLASIKSEDREDLGFPSGKKQTNVSSCFL